MSISVFFFFNDTATTEIYTLSLHDALPICHVVPGRQRLGAGTQECLDRPGLRGGGWVGQEEDRPDADRPRSDRKSTRLNSSHANISYAVFCLKKKKNTE